MKVPYPELDRQIVIVKLTYHIWKNADTFVRNLHPETTPDNFKLHARAAQQAEENMLAAERKLQDMLTTLYPS